MTASILPAVVLAAALSGGPGSAGVGIGASDVCLSATAQPGGSYTPGAVYVTNTGSATEHITLQTSPVPPGLAGTIGNALPIPPDWVTFGYPALLWVIGQHSVTLAPGQGTSIPVTLHIPASASRGDYKAELIASTTGARAPGDGGQAVLGAAAATNLEFAVGTAPPDCNPPPAPQPWWAAPPAARTALPAGWSYRPGTDADGDILLSGVWTYIPSRGTAPVPAGTPPGWIPGAQMQVWTYDGGSSFVMNRVPGWRYLPGTGPLGTTLYQPPGGKLPGWALRLAAGDSYTIPSAGPGASPVIIPAMPASSPTSPGALAGSSATTTRSRLTAVAAIAVLALAGLAALSRRKRRRQARDSWP